MVKPPPLSLSLKRLLEKRRRLVDTQKVDLVRRLFIGIPRRYHHRVYFELVVQEIEDVLTAFGESELKKVVLVATRKPLDGPLYRRDGLVKSSPRGWRTLSWRSFRPSMWMTHENAGGV